MKNISLLDFYCKKIQIQYNYLELCEHLYFFCYSAHLA